MTIRTAVTVSANNPAASESTERSASRAGAEASTGRLLLGIVLVAWAIRLIVVHFVYPGFLAPGRDHWEFGYETGKIGRSILLGEGFSNPYYGGDTGPTAIIGPVFPYIVAGVMAVFGIYTKASALALLSLNSLISAVTCVPIFFVARKCFGVRVARWSAWVWAFFPYAIYFSADSIWYRALITLFLTSIFLATLHLHAAKGLGAWAGYGVLAGVAALIDPVVLTAMPFLGAWACYQMIRERRSWIVPIITTAAVGFLTISPWLVRNSLVFHHPVFLRSGFPQAFLVGNAGNSVHWWNGFEDPSGNPAELDEYHRVGEQGYMHEKWPRVIALVEANPAGFLWRSVRRFVYMWTGYWSFSKEYLQEEPFDPANIPFSTVVTCLALLGLRRLFRSDRNLAWLFALLLLSFPVVYYVTNPYLAYRHPLDPELVMLSVYAIFSWRAAEQAKENAAEPAARVQ